mmetsp:Transcript_18155/g.63780  ORF Transcript_18155/g.63780 Transcript_18155/m.63780 type:complete len:405 (+) Transcript_18155:243-1457(+)
MALLAAQSGAGGGAARSRAASPGVQRATGGGNAAQPTEAAAGGGKELSPDQAQEKSPAPSNGSNGKTASGDARLKMGVLAFLVVQNSSASLTMRYSKVRPGVEPWNSQTAVLMQEVLKATVCATLLARDGSLGSVFSNRAEALKTAVPAVLYLVQNNLQYVAVTYLDASTYAVMYQLKILTTALLSMLILGKRLSVSQCMSLVLLTAGVSTVVLSQLSIRNAGSKDPSLIWRGVGAVLMSCVSSGLAGVSFEKLLKGSSVSLWSRNLHLALYSSVVGFAGLRWSDPELSWRDDFFKGYSLAVWVSIINNAFGGLLIAVVIKYADNILKNFSTSLSIILTAVLSVCFFGTPINAEFLCGTSMVLYAVFLYSGIGIPAVLRDKCAAGVRPAECTAVDADAAPKKTT